MTARAADKVNRTTYALHALGGDGPQLGVETTGEGGPACVLVHGFGESRAAWAGVIQGLAPLGKVITIELRGHGDSEWDVQARYDVQDHVDDLMAVLGQLALDRYVLVGHSMGGAAALRVAASSPTGPAGLVLVDYGPSPTAAGSDHVTAEFEASGRPYGSIAEYAEWLASRRPLASPAVLRCMAEHELRRRPNGQYVLKRDPAMLASRRGAAPPTDAWALLARTRCPVHIVRGAGSSMLTKSVAAEMVRLPLRSSLATVAMAGHGVMADNPQGFLAAVEPFIAECLRE